MQRQNPSRYNIRVYGICIREDGKVLITDERRNGFPMTKFPGGGHHLGEGLGETLLREFMEEASLPVAQVTMFYLNDFLQISQFDPRDQLISMYYLVRPLAELDNALLGDRRHAYRDGAADVQTFRWMALGDLDENDFTFPIDRIVVQKLREYGDLVHSLMDHGDLS